MDALFTEVNQALSGLRVAEEVGLEPAREQFKYACPARTRDSSDGLHAYPRSGSGAHCFSCWTHFSAVDLAAAALGCSPPEACRHLTNRFEIQPDRAYQVHRKTRRARTRPKSRSAESNTVPSDDHGLLQVRAEVYGGIVEELRLDSVGRRYLANRGLDLDLAYAQGFRSIDSPEQWRRLRQCLNAEYSVEDMVTAGFAYLKQEGGSWRSWFPWNEELPPALLIPYFSRTAQIEAIRFRRMVPGSPRYMALLKAGARIPWRCEAFDGPRPLELVITEGELDGLSLLQCGYDALALGGATPSRYVVEWVAEAAGDASSLALWTDADAAGKGAVDRLAAVLAERHGLRWVEEHVCRWSSEADPNDLLRSRRVE